MTILAHIHYRQQDIRVRVLDVWVSGDGRKVALIETLDGSRPFTTITHGGPMESDSIVIRAGALRNISPEDES